MLKLNASYSKKVPAGEEYSSQSYHASVEVELPDGLTQDQLQARIHETFDLVRNSVEAELHGNDLTALILLQTDRKTLLKAGEQETVRTTVRRVRNSSLTCLIWPVSVA